MAVVRWVTAMIGRRRCAYRGRLVLLNLDAVRGLQDIEKREIVADLAYTRHAEQLAVEALTY